MPRSAEKLLDEKAAHGGKIGDMPSEDNSGWLRDDGAGNALLRVRVIPRASRDSIEGLLGDALKVRLRAPPVEGKANAALAALIAAAVGRPVRAVEPLSGGHARTKTLRLRGCPAALARERLSAAIGTGADRRG